MASLFPREEHAEALFHRILSNPGAEQQLYETFCMEQENASFEDGGGAECSFAKALLQAYENRDISALTIALCNNTMFDLAAHSLSYSVSLSWQKRRESQTAEPMRTVRCARNTAMPSRHESCASSTIFTVSTCLCRVRRSIWPMAVICATSTPKTCRCGRCIRRPAAAC